MDRYNLCGDVVDSIDLKALVVSRGIKVSPRIYRAASKTGRVHADPLKCNCLILPDGTIVQMTDLRLHLGYLKNALSWDSIKQIKYFSQMNTPFALDLNGGGEPALYYGGREITTVRFPAPTGFYGQRTASGLPFLGTP